MTDANINQLILQCAQGKRSALSELYHLESSRLLGLIMAIVRNQALAEDILHDLFVRVWTRADSFDAEGGNGQAWLSRMARNLALNTQRYAYREASLSTDQEMPELDAVLERLSHEPEPRSSRERHTLLDCLKQLDTEQRSAVVKAYVHGLTHSELASHLDKPLGTVKAWVQRSLIKLRECMS
ncbi:sigma-70 family RNA polymerase sigma factor [Marinobacterium stanieri]|nr:sigma-70 family RNA polymerase sigma factor [Marinobacterium stanieri]